MSGSTWHVRRHLVAIVVFSFFLSSAPYRASFLAVAAATCGRRCGVSEADCRGIGVRALRSATATLGLGSLHQQPRVGGTLCGALRDGSDGWRSPAPRADNTGRRVFSTSSVNHPRRQVAYIVMPHGVDSVRDGRSCAFRRVHFPVCSTRRCGVLVASCCGSSKKASTRVAGPLFLGSKKQRVVNIVTGA